MSRGDHRKSIFKDHRDRAHFVETLAEAKRETEEQKAERIVGEELRKPGWAEGKLKERRETNPEKVKVAQRLRQETVMTLDWIAKRMEMGCRHALGN